MPPVPTGSAQRERDTYGYGQPFLRCVRRCLWITWLTDAALDMGALDGALRAVKSSPLTASLSVVKSGTVSDQSSPVAHATRTTPPSSKRGSLDDGSKAVKQTTSADPPPAGGFSRERRPLSWHYKEQGSPVSTITSNPPGKLRGGFPKSSPPADADAKDSPPAAQPVASPMSLLAHVSDHPSPSPLLRFGVLIVRRFRRFATTLRLSATDPRRCALTNAAAPPAASGNRAPHLRAVEGAAYFPTDAQHQSKPPPVGAPSVCVARQLNKQPGAKLESRRHGRGGPGRL